MLAESLQVVAGIRHATVGMGTLLNIDTLIADGFPADPLCQAWPNDSIIVIDAVDNESARAPRLTV